MLTHQFGMSSGRVWPVCALVGISLGLRKGDRADLVARLGNVPDTRMKRINPHDPTPLFSRRLSTAGATRKREALPRRRPASQHNLGKRVSRNARAIGMRIE